MASSSSQQSRLRPGAWLCARRLLFIVLLLGAVCAGIFSDFLLTVRLKTTSGGQEAPSETKVVIDNLAPARSLKTGDEVAVREDFVTDSTPPVKVQAGSRGLVLRVDEEGDAEINFVGLSREWVYSSKFPNLGVIGGSAESATSNTAVAPAPTAPAVSQVEREPEKDKAQAFRAAAKAAIAAQAKKAAGVSTGDAKDLPSDASQSAPAPMPKAPAPAPKKPKKVGPYKPLLHAAGQECQVQALELGNLPKVEDCDKMVAEESACGGYFMFSQEHPDWKCRCCDVGGESNGPKAPVWSVYKAQLEKSLPEAESSNGDKAKLHSKGHECDDQAFNFGKVNSPEECDALTAEKSVCGAHFMFSKLHPDWGCRCCSRTGADDGPDSSNWNVYAVRAPLPENRKALPPAAVLNPSIGLPLVEGPRPKWLVKEDGLIMDGRPTQHGGILILQAVLMDASKGWGKKQGFRPRWLRAILAANREHARKFGHALIVRSRPTEPQVTAWQKRQCNKKSPEVCRKDNERENYNWEKHLMLAEYLLSPQNFTHVMMLDADAAFIRQDHDTLAMIIELMEKNKKDLFLTDEDWLKYGEGRINGGLIVAKNTAFTRGLFQDTFDAHILGPTPLKSWRIGLEHVVCSSNEQICLNDLWKGGRGAHFAEFTMMAGGKKWNHGAEVGGFDDPGVEILHFMGGSKGTADKVLCDGSRDVTGEGPKGYGCKQ